MFRAAVIFLCLAVVIAAARMWAISGGALDGERLSGSMVVVKVRKDEGTGYPFFDPPAGAGGVEATPAVAKQPPRKRRPLRRGFSMLVPDQADMAASLRFDSLQDSYGSSGFGPRRNPARVRLSGPVLAAKIQAELRRVGCYMGFETGKWDRSAMRAMKRFNRAAGTSFNIAMPDAAALEVLAKSRGNVCFSKVAAIRRHSSPFAGEEEAAPPSQAVRAGPRSAGRRVAPRAGEVRPPVRARTQHQRSRVLERVALQRGGGLGGLSSGKGVKGARRGPATAQRVLFPPRNDRLQQQAEQDERLLIVKLQNELTRIGCYDGPINGKWAGETRRAVIRFNRFTETRLPTDGPDALTLEAIKLRRGDVCLLKARKRRLLQQAKAEEDETDNKVPVSLRLLSRDGSLMTTADTASAPDLRSPEAVHDYLSVLIKTQLRRVGCYHGGMGGGWDADTQDAMALFNFYSRASLPTDVPAREALRTLLATSGKVCPIGCLIKGDGGTVPDDGRCIRPQARADRSRLRSGQDGFVDPTHADVSVQ